MLIRDVGLMAEAVYDPTGSVPGAQVLRRYLEVSRWDGFQAAAYAIGGQVVVAFRGTTVGGDFAADAALGTGMNSEYFALGEQFVAGLGQTVSLLCGHSLGGAIAQVVANRMSIPMVTFNAPGVAVLASRNIGTASIAASAVRLAGMTASAVVQPGQAWRDVRSAFNAVKGLNVCLQFDAVSRIGVHYGEVVRIPGTSRNPLTEHGIATMNSVLGRPGHPVGSRVASF